MDDAICQFAPGVSGMRQVLSNICDKQLFFVGGSPKSGTTWVQLLLDAHPEVACTGETHFLDQLVPAIGKPINDHQAYADWLNANIFRDLKCCPSLNGDQLVDVLRVALALLVAPQVGGKSVKAIGEKTPDNVHHLPVMNHLFPNAKFIQTVRDGRDCAVSGWHHNRRVSPAWADANPLPAYAIEVARGWSLDLEKGRIFGEQSPGRYLLVKYEDLGACPREAFSRVLTFLGVDPVETVVDECIDSASFETLTGGRRRGQEDAASFFRKGVSGDWKNYLDKETEEIFFDVAGHWLERLGYV